MPLRPSGDGVDAGAVVATRVRLAFVLVCGERRLWLAWGDRGQASGGDTKSGSWHCEVIRWTTQSYFWLQCKSHL